MTETASHIKITKQVDLGLEEIFNGISELETPDLENFIQRLGRLIARRKATSLPERESDLLVKINQIIPTTLQKRYESLLDKNRSETITDIEHEELLVVINDIETKNVTERQ